jgi:hypothetical protein
MIADQARGRIGGLSPDVAQAKSIASVRQLAADQATARILGDEIAENIDVRSRIRAARQGLTAQAAEPLLQNFNAILEVLAFMLEKANQVAQDNPGVVSGASRLAARTALNAFFPGLGDAFDFYLPMLSKLLGDKPPDVSGNLLIDLKPLPLPYPFNGADERLPTPPAMMPGF